MDKIAESRHASLRSIQIAKYLLTTTYPLLKEPKTLLSISDHVFSSFISSISMLLLSERNKKTIPPYHNTDESKLNSFKNNFVRKYNFEEYLETIERIDNLAKQHKKSAVEFSRDKKFVVCDNQFKNVQIISEQNVKTYIQKAIEFNEKISNMVSNE